MYKCMKMFEFLTGINFKDFLFSHWDFNFGENGLYEHYGFVFLGYRWTEAVSFSNVISAGQPSSTFRFCWEDAWKGGLWGHYDSICLLCSLHLIRSYGLSLICESWNLKLYFICPCGWLEYVSRARMKLFSDGFI